MSEARKAASEPSLMVVGVNYRTARLEIRERFWIAPERRRPALEALTRAEGIEEAAVLATCNRSEFVLWTQDACTAAASVLRFLTQEYGLRLGEWKHFYRLLDEAALAHVFRLTCGLDAMAAGEPDIVEQVQSAWSLAREAGSCGRVLEAVFRKAMNVTSRVREETEFRASGLTAARAGAELARQIFGSLEGRKVLLLGAGQVSSSAGQCLLEQGAGDLRIASRTAAKAEELAARLGGAALPAGQIRRQLEEVDAVISCTSCPEVMLRREEIEAAVPRRAGAPLLLIDVAVPRNIDSGARAVHGVFLYDLDDLEQLRKPSPEERQAMAEAEKLVAAEAKCFRGRLPGERLVPTIVALRGRLREICEHELEDLEQEAGPFPPGQEQSLEALTARITQRLASTLARELMEVPEKVEQEQMTAAVERLFHLEEGATTAARK